MTPKEINGLVRAIKEESFVYSEFKERLYNVRLEIAKNRLCEINLDKIGQHVVN
jgi:hypothetical protein